LGRKRSVGIEAKYGQAVLPLERDIDKTAAGMEIQMSRAEPQTVAVGGDRLEAGELAIDKVEHFEMAGIFRLGRGGVIAPAAEGQCLVAGRDPNLVRVDAEVRTAGLCHFLTDGA